jgi:hypothetical protein
MMILNLLLFLQYFLILNANICNSFSYNKTIQHTIGTAIISQKPNIAILTINIYAIDDTIQ